VSPTQDYALLAFMHAALNLPMAPSSIDVNFPSPIHASPNIPVSRFSLATVLRKRCSDGLSNGAHAFFHPLMISSRRLAWTSALCGSCSPALPRAYPDQLQFTSNPYGATAEFDGVAIGAAPREKGFPGGSSIQELL
jgi:hypothetical protein